MKHVFLTLIRKEVFSRITRYVRIGMQKEGAGAHRASVTKIITSLSELAHASPVDVSKLKQKRLSLSTKGSLLAKLDEELLSVLPDEELEKEVEEADAIQERIGLNIVEIDELLRIVS